MASVNISDQDLAFIQEQVGTGVSPTPEQYVSHLIRAEQKRRAKASLEAKLLEGLESGPMEEWTKQDLEEMRRKVREQASRRTAS